MAGGDPEAAAAFRQGAVSPAELASFRRYRHLEGGTAGIPAPPLAEDAETIVLLRVLDRRFDALPPLARQEQASRWRRWTQDLAETRLRDAVRKEVAPSEEEIRRAFDRDPSAWAVPRRWQLENILKRLPEGAGAKERNRLRQAMEGIRARVLAGEDFAALATRESESETRLRGGRMGAVALGQLERGVARVVAGLEAGDVSPVIESADGLTLLRCAKVLEARPPSLEDARRSIALGLVEERFAAAWDALISKRTGDLPEGYRLEAERRGLLARKDDDLLFEWKAREMRARAVERAEVEAHVPEPSEKELRAAYEAEAGSVVPARVTLRGLKLALRQDRPRSLYDDARKLGERLAAGGMRFEDAATTLGAAAELVELGSRTEAEVWGMGLNLDAAVAATPVGGTTRLVQEGRTLWILHVVAREPERPLSFDEARETLRRTLLEGRRRAAVAEFRRRILEEQRVLVAP